MDEAKAIAETALGPIKGQERDGIFLFRGIPFARPPLGESRFEPPSVIEELSTAAGEPFDATKAPPAAPQNSFLGGVEIPGLTVRETNEDCLYLNIWTDGLDGEHRPVMVWIHGGGFTTGSGSLPLYKGQRLAAEHGVVVVTINYRLGILGFLHLGIPFADRFPDCTNLGLRDQVAALDWVKKNIAAFGGDPQNVTVFGESAGAMSIGTLMGIPAADGFYHRAILQSGAAHFIVDSDAASRLCNEVLEHLGISEPELARLKELDVDEILKAQLSLEMPGSDEGGERDSFLPFLPARDEGFVENLPLERIRSGDAPSVPVIVGSNLEEFKLFATRDPAMGSLTKARVVRRMRILLGSDSGAAEEIYDAYEKASARRGESTDPNDLWLSIAADGIFRIPAIRLAEALIEAGQSAYVYLFGWRTPLLGASHGIDVPFVFGNLGGKAAEPFIGPAEGAERLSLAMREAWTSFATRGRPSAADLAVWPEYDLEERPVMVLDEDPRIELDPYAEERQVWEGHL
jgi:para-nitrobenzyl esterase